MNENFSNEELIAAYLLHKSFAGEELQQKMKQCGIREEVRKLTFSELKDLLEARFSRT